MKKLILIVVAILFSVASFSQAVLPGFIYKTSTNKFSKQLKAGTLVYIVNDSALYCLKATYGSGKTFADVISDGNYITIFTQGLVTTLGGIATDSLVIGNQKLTETNTNLATFNNSLKVTDTAFIGSANYMFQNNVNGVKVPNSLTATDTVYGSHVYGVTQLIVGTQTISSTANRATFNNSIVATDTTITNALSISGLLIGNASIRDTANFGTDATANRNKYARKKVVGITANDRFIVVPVMGSTTAVPGTGEFLGYYCTTDSIIISRNTATTAGLKVAFFRIK